MILILLVHGLRIGFELVRSWDVHTRGILSKKGLLKTPLEKWIKLFEVFTGCLVIGFCISDIISNDRIKFDKNPLLMTWAIVDSIIILLSFLFLSQMQSLQMASQITRNIYTMFFM
jgi:hypothetical protein